MLAEDVTSVADGGGTPGVARLPVHGAEKVARYLATVTGRYVEGLNEAGCPTCLSIADAVDGVLLHLHARHATMLSSRRTAQLNGERRSRSTVSCQMPSRWAMRSRMPTVRNPAS